MRLFSSIFLGLFLLGCKSTPASKYIPPVDAAPTVGAFEERDQTVVAAADRIDVAVVDTPAAAPVKQETDTIRHAVASTPAADVQALVDSFMELTARYEDRITSLEGSLEKERTMAMRSQAKYLNWVGIGFLAAFGFSFFAGPAAAIKTWPLGVIGAGCFGLAQIISSPWFLRGASALLILGVGYGSWWVYDRHRQGRLEQALNKRVRLLKKIVPTIDAANDEARDTLKSAFREVFDTDDKAEILELKKEMMVDGPRT